MEAHDLTLLFDDALAWVEAHHDLILSLTAIFALGTSAVAMSGQRRHNRNSVLPIPFIDFGDYENKLSVALRNVGVGPLIIEKLTVSNSRTGAEGGSVVEFMPDLPDLMWSEFVQDDISGRPIAPGEELLMLELSAPPGNNPLNSAHKAAVRTSLSELTMTVVVKDIYGKRKKCTRAFDWFARLLPDNSSSPEREGESAEAFDPHEDQ
jgi:hypothetical protein